MNRLRRVGLPVGFVEVPDFHVAVVRLGRAELADQSFVVGGDPDKRGKILAATPELRALGIESGMLVDEALTRSPSAVWVETDMPLAREYSGRLRAAVRQQVAALEGEGLSGFYFEAPRDRSEALELFDRLKARVAEKTGLPIRMGVAPVRFAARMAAEDLPASQARVIDEGSFETFLLQQPLERFPGVGPKTAARLAELGARDVPGLRSLGRERLEILLGNHGRSLWLLASGEDPKPLRVRRHPATLSRERSLVAGTGGPHAIERVLEEDLEKLSESLSAALVREGLVAGRIALRLTFEGARTVTRSQTFSTSIMRAGELAAAARGLMERIELEGEGVRKLALVLAGLDLKGAEDRQLDLFKEP